MSSQVTTTGHYCAPEKRKYVLTAAILASALGFIDTTVVSIAIPQIRDALGAGFAQAQWVSNAYILFLAAFMLVAGAVGDRIGLKRAFGWGIVVFLVASLLCAIAWSPETLIAFRAVQGMGAAAMVPGSMAIISRNFPRDERGRALGIWVAASSVASISGPALGGLVLTYGGIEAWRGIFAINLPIGGVALWILWSKVPNDEPASRYPVDWLGGVLATLAMGTIAAGLTLIGEGGATTSVVALMGAGFTSLALGVWRWLNIAHPMIDLSLFRSRVFSGANVLTFLVWAGLGAVLLFLPMVLIVGWQMSELAVAATLLPFGGTIAALSPAAGKLSDRHGPRPILTSGCIVAVGGYLLMAWGLVYQDYWAGVLPAMLLLGLAMALLASPLSTAIMLSVDDSQAGAASGINNMIARIAGLVAIAGLGAVVSAVYATFIRASSLPAEIQILMIDAGFGERLTGGLYQITTQEAHLLGMNHALALVCCVIAALCLCGALVGWLTQQGSTRP